jgi:hypothetical protein
MLSILLSDFMSLKILHSVIWSINCLNSATTDANHSKGKTSLCLVDNISLQDGTVSTLAGSKTALHKDSYAKRTVKHF